MNHEKSCGLSIHYEGMLRKEVLEYPAPALRKAILNSIVHKNML